MGTFNHLKAKIGETLVSNFYDSVIEQEAIEEIREKIKEVNDIYDTEFSSRICGTMCYTLDKIFFIKLTPGYYDGFSISIDSKFSIKKMEKEIDTGLFKIDEISDLYLKNDEPKMNFFYRYIAEKIMPEYIDDDGVMTNVFSEMTDDEREEQLLIPIEKDLMKYFSYLSYKIMEIGEIYGMYNLKRNGYFPEVKKVTKKDVLYFKANFIKEDFDDRIKYIPNFEKMNFKQVKLYVEEMMLKNYSEFVKAVIAVEYEYKFKDMNDSKKDKFLGKVYMRFIENDCIGQILNEKISEIISEIEES